MAEIAGMREELDRLQTTFDRLKKLNAAKLKPSNIYGSTAASENIDASLARWLAHKENTVKNQLAMIPSRPDDVYIKGVFQDPNLFRAR